jgi:hypothetical protein
LFPDLFFMLIPNLSSVFLYGQNSTCNLRNAQKMTCQSISVHEPFNMRSSRSDRAARHCIEHLAYKTLFSDLPAPLRIFPHLQFIAIPSQLIITHCAKSCATSPWDKVIWKKTRYIDFKIYSRPIRRCQNRENRTRFDHMVGCWKCHILSATKWIELWPPVSPATDVREGQTRANFTRLDKLY